MWNPMAVYRQQEEEKKEIEKVAEAFRIVFNKTEYPNKVLKHLSRLCYLGSSSYVKGNPYDTARREGARLVMLEILKLIDMEPMDVLKLEQEDPLYFDIS